MSFRIAIASGKGGTGKTSISVSLFHLFEDKFQGHIRLIDCDVEEPNDAIFFPEAKELNHRVVNQLIPTIDLNRCTYCRKCVEYCEFNAIVVIPPVPFAEVNNSLCHSCGACLEACKFDAFTEIQHPIGHIHESHTANGNKLSEGRLKIGSAMQTLLIRELKRQNNENGQEQSLHIYDAPPGTSCPVVETVSDSDYIILVTEPTPFGLYDLKLSIDMIREVKLPFGIIINKAGLGNKEVYDFIAEQNIELLGEIPFNREYASMYAKGEILKNIPEKIEKEYQKIIDILLKKMEIK
jgi:MinD superfamily P-loop ATPase